MSELRSTTKPINMHKAHKALATRWPPSGHLSPAFGTVHTELLAMALAMQKKWVEYPFLAMNANANAIARSSVWTEPKGLWRS